MKVKVFSEVKPLEEPEVHLQLWQCCNCVELIMVHPETGRPILDGIIAKIKNDGTIHLCDGVNSHIGLQLDERGRIRLA